VKKLVWRVGVVGVWSLALGLIVSSPLCRADEASPKSSLQNEAGLYVKVQLARRVKFSKLRVGEIVEGSLTRDVYSADHKVYSAGSHVRLSVDHLEKRKRPPNDHWPWVVKAFTPRHEKYPIFREAVVERGKSEETLKVSVIAMSRRREVQAGVKKSNGQSSVVSSATGGKKNSVTPIMVMEAFQTEAPTKYSGPMEPGMSNSDASGPETLPIGTRCKIVLLSNMSASKNKPGEVVNARLLEPVLLDARAILPAGSYFQGKIVKTTPPRWLSRSGSLYFNFTEVTLPNGDVLPVTASLAGAELDERSHTRIDAEGKLHGERPGKAWMAINLGMTSGIAKEADDTVQLVIEAIVSTATDASTAGTARLVSSCVSAIYVATRHGRDVVLPRFTEMDISLDRPLSVHAAEVTASNAAVPAK
jgi:hypothetical protein